MEHTVRILGSETLEAHTMPVGTAAPRPSRRRSNAKASSSSRRRADLTVDEMIAFVGFDSTRPYEPNALHVAFEDTTVHDPFPPSIVETRYFALFE